MKERWEIPGNSLSARSPYNRPSLELYECSKGRRGMGSIATLEELGRKIHTVTRQFSGEVGFAAVNLTSGEEIVYDAGRVFPTASVIKLAILVELFRQAH